MIIVLLSFFDENLFDEDDESNMSTPPAATNEAVKHDVDFNALQ